MLATLTPWIAGLGLGVFTAREVARSHLVREVFATVGGFSFLLGLCLSPLAFPVARLLAAHRPVVHAFVLVTFLLLPLSLPAGALGYVAIGRHSWGRVTATRLIAAGSAALAIVCLYLAEALTVASAGAAVIASGFLAVTPNIGVLRGGGSWRFSPSLLWRGLRFGLQAWLADLAALSNARLDQLLMVGLVSSRQLGIYAVAVSASALSGVVPAALGLTVLTQTAVAGGAAVARHVRIILAVGICVGLIGAGRLQS